MKTKKFLAILLTLVMMMAMAATVFAAGDQGTIEKITEVATVDGSNITVSTTSLNWYPADASIGRYQDGWWFGFKIVAPATVTDSNVSNVKYSNDGTENLSKNFGTNNDGKTAGGNYYMGCWLPVTPEYLTVAAGRNLQWTYKFDWDGDGTADQTFVATVESGNITLNKDGEVYFKTENGVIVADNRVGEPTDNGLGSITMNNAVVGETYKLYKVFDLTFTGESTSYSYTKKDGTDDFYSALAGTDSPFTLTETVIAGTYNVSLVAGKTAADVAKFLKANETSLTEYAKDGMTKTGLDESNKANAATVKWENIDYGYYYIESSLGSLITVNSTLPNVIVEEKNEVPTLTKEVYENSDNSWGAANDANTGDVVKFKITVTALPGAENYVIHDSLDEKGALNYVFEHYSNSQQMRYLNGKIGENRTYAVVSSTEIVAGGTLTLKETTGSTWGADIATMTVAEDMRSFTIAFNQTFLDTITEATTITFNYVARLTGSEGGQGQAIAAAGFKNTAYLTYGNAGKTTDAVTTTKTWTLDILKYTGAEKTALANAEFTLTSNDAAVKLISKGVLEGDKADTNAYEVNTNAADTDEGYTTTVVSGANGKIMIKGLDSGEYVLTETKAPAGYNLLTSPVYLKVTDTGYVYVGTKGADGTITYSVNAAYWDVEIENNTGAELPSTGGTGTTIFYVLGSVLVLAAIVLFVTKRRMGDAK